MGSIVTPSSMALIIDGTHAPLMVVKKGARLLKGSIVEWQVDIDTKVIFEKARLYNNVLELRFVLTTNDPFFTAINKVVVAYFHSGTKHYLDPTATQHQDTFCARRKENPRDYDDRVED